VTDVLLPVVALDDAVGLAVFAISFGVARALSSGTVDVVSIAVDPFVEIVLSLVMGGLLGEVLTQLEKLFHSNRNRMALIVGFVLLTVALSMREFDVGAVHVAFSSLLVCMALGVVFCNRCPLADEMMDKADKWTSPLFAMFFILSGAELDLSVFKSAAVVGIGLLYIIFRCVGKYLGASLGTTVTGYDKNVRRWLGVTLFPQAGVALGMSVTVSSWGAEGALIRNIILFGVLVYELFGPVMTKYALTKSGDIQPKSPEVEHRRENYLAEKGK
jgi:Kef-type K+ transport system membrane component KefB